MPIYTFVAVRNDNGSFRLEMRAIGYRTETVKLF